MYLDKRGGCSRYCYGWMLEVVLALRVDRIFNSSIDHNTVTRIFQI
jgi:hypothetical protein